MQSDHELEQLLRKAPAPAAPATLQQRLVQQAGRLRREEPPLRRWFSLLQQRSWAPGLALFAIMAGLLAVLAFQQNTLTELKKAQQELAAQIPSPDAEAQRQKQISLQNEFELLQKQGMELNALRAEMAEIEKLLAEQPQLAAENAALRAELAGLTRNNPAASPEIQAALAQAREKANRIRCVNNLKQIGLAARIWAVDHPEKQQLPMDYSTMKDELNSPKVLICPSDSVRGEAQSGVTWEQFPAVGASYDMLSPGVSENSPNAVYVRCPFHNNVLRVDGSVIQLKPEQRVVQRNGMWEVEE